MNKERLVIKNFGPIKSMDLELGKMTILIGEQATGKSTIAKVLAICRYFSFIVDYNVLGKTEDQFYKGLRYWDINTYFNKNSFIQYENDDYKITVKYGVVEHSYQEETKTELKIEGCVSNLISKSKRFNDLLKELENIKPLKDKNFDYSTFVSDDWWNWTPDENFFRLNVKKVMENPFFIPTERGLQSVFSLGRNINNLTDSLLEQLSQLNRIVRGFNVELKINSVELTYKNENGLGFTKKKLEESFYLLNSGASGYQSVIPIEIAIYYYSKIEKRRRTFIVEEPELNLFPKAQKKLIEFFSDNINTNGHSFLLPTHSPYILSSVNNLLYAYYIAHLNNGAFKVQVDKIIPQKYWLNPEEISVYYLNEEGTNVDIFDKNENLINTDYIDSVSRIISKEFDELLNMEVSFTNKDLYD